jgi:hypothetical protein
MRPRARVERASSTQTEAPRYICVGLAVIRI